MSDRSLDSMLAEAIPGSPMARMPGLPEGIERPWRMWRSNASRWAVYVISGNYWPRTTEHAITSIKEQSSVKPCLLVSEVAHIGTVAEHFIKLDIPVVAEIGGEGTLLYPPERPKPARRVPACPSRIPADVLKGCSQSESLSVNLRKLISELYGKYRKVRKEWSDDYEQRILDQFFLEFAATNGLRKKPSSAQDVLRRLERARMGGNRDHYFHSFQNFFLGLWAVGGAYNYFKKWQRVAKLSWKLSPEFVWFLVTMWHDVGYALRQLEQMEPDVLGIDAEDIAAERLSLYRQNPDVQEGLREISSLTEHLLKIRPKTGWLPPPVASRRSKLEQEVEGVFLSDLGQGHGSASALRLYLDMKSFIDKCAIQTERQVLRQSALLAAASIPFHDWRFRKCIRQSCGECRIPALTMPFAALLAFVDSIQDDRRTLDEIRPENPFLHELIVDGDRKISALVDPSALKDSDIIWKMIEAKDVLAALECDRNTLEVKYPGWLAK